MREIIGELLDSGGYSRIGDYRIAAVGGQFLSLVHHSFDDQVGELNGWKIHLMLMEMMILVAVDFSRVFGERL